MNANLASSSQVSRPASALKRKRERLPSQAFHWYPTSFGACCKKNCLEQTGIDRCRELRKTFLSSSQIQRKSYLLEAMSLEHRRLQFYGISVCTRLLESCPAVSKKLIDAVKGNPSAGASQTAHRAGSTRNGGEAQS